MRYAFLCLLRSTSVHNQRLYFEHFLNGGRLNYSTLNSSKTVNFRRDKTLSTLTLNLLYGPFKLFQMSRILN